MARSAHVHSQGEMQEGVAPPAVGVRGLCLREVFEILHVKTLHFGALFHINTKKLMSLVGAGSS